MTPEWQVKHCKSCGHPMVWARVAATGKPIPLDADLATSAPTSFPDAEGAGRIQLATVEPSLFGGAVATVRVLGAGDSADPAHEVWLSHFVSCPHAESWRAG